MDEGGLSLSFLLTIGSFRLSLLLPPYFLFFCPLFFHFVSFSFFLLLCLFLDGFHLESDLFFDLLDDLIIVELLSLLELGLSDTEGMIVLVDPILPFSFSDLDLLDDSNQIVA